jgi:hypothetical protein
MRLPSILVLALVNISILCLGVYGSDIESNANDPLQRKNIEKQIEDNSSSYKKRKLNLVISNNSQDLEKEQESSPSALLLLPNELKLQIFSSLPLINLLILSNVSKDLYSFTQEKTLLEPIFNQSLAALEKLDEEEKLALKAFIGFASKYWIDLYSGAQGDTSRLFSSLKFLNALHKFSKIPSYILQSLCEVTMNNELDFERVLLIGFYERHLLSKNMRKPPPPQFQPYEWFLPQWGEDIFSLPSRNSDQLLGFPQLQQLKEESEEEEYTPPPCVVNPHGHMQQVPLNWIQERNSFIQDYLKLPPEHLKIIGAHSSHLFVPTYNKKSRETIIAACLKLSPEKLATCLNFIEGYTCTLTAQEKVLSLYKAFIIESYDQLTSSELKSRLDAIRLYASFLFTYKSPAFESGRTYQLAPLFKSCLALSCVQLERLALHTRCFNFFDEFYDYELNNFLIDICHNLNSEQIVTVQMHLEDLDSIYTADEECEDLIKSLPPEHLTLIAAHRNDLFPEERNCGYPYVLKACLKLNVEQLKVVISYADQLFPFKWMHGMNRAPIMNECSKLHPSILIETVELIKAYADTLFYQDKDGYNYDDEEARRDFIIACLNLSPQQFSVIATHADHFFNRYA